MGIYMQREREKQITTQWRNLLKKTIGKKTREMGKPGRFSQMQWNQKKENTNNRQSRGKRKENPIVSESRSWESQLTEERRKEGGEKSNKGGQEEKGERMRMGNRRRRVRIIPGGGEEVRWRRRRSKSLPPSLLRPPSYLSPSTRTYRMPEQDVHTNDPTVMLM